MAINGLDYAAENTAEDSIVFDGDEIETIDVRVECIPERVGSLPIDLTSFSVIICCHSSERYQDAIEAIESVLDQTISDVEVIVVIDRNEQLYRRLSNHYGYYGSVKVLMNNKLPGLSASRNIGLAHVKGDIIAFLDDDAVADKNWLAHLQAMYSNNDVIGCGGPIMPLWIAGEAKWIPEEFYWVMGCTYKGFNNQQRRIRSNFGSNMSFRRIALEDEQFDTNTGITDGKGVGEEVELSLRLAKRFPSQYVYHCPEAIVYHRIYDFRKSVKHLFNRCYQYGFSIGSCSRGLNDVREEVAQEDKNMAIYLFIGAIPKRIAGLFSSEKTTNGVARELVQLAITFFSAITIISGLFFCRLMEMVKVGHRS